MFRESLLETSAANVAQRGWATLMSFGLETVGVGILLVTPMVITQSIPMINNEQSITAPLAAPARMPEPESTQIFSAGRGDDTDDGAFVEPRFIPTHISTGPDPVRHMRGGDAVECDTCIIGAIPMVGDNVPGGNTILRDLVRMTRPGAHEPAPPVQKKLYVSRIDEGLLIAKIEPKYPPLARVARVEGEVLLAAVIGTDGRIEHLKVISGHPMLAGAALDAVRQWRYRPTMLNGQPVEVDTTISVRFILRQD